MTSTSMSKKLLLSLLILGMLSGVSADYYYGNSHSGSITGDTGFSVPQYESQREIITQLVAPFLFVSILLQILFNRALRFAFVDEDQNRGILDLVENNRPNLRRESTLMAITATAILIPTPFWDYVRWATASIAVISVTGLIVVILFLFYLVWKL